MKLIVPKEIVCQEQEVLHVVSNEMDSYSPDSLLAEPLSFIIVDFVLFEIQETVQLLFTGRQETTMYFQSVLTESDMYF